MERPILFSAPMVNAILQGRKTQTRRLIKRRGLASIFHDGWTDDYVLDPGNAEWRENGMVYRMGDLLWVRETVRAEELETGIDGVHYLADDEFRPIENSEEASTRWIELFHYRGKRGAKVPPIHMPRWASRISLRVTGVKAERLQDITEEDARAEGCAPVWSGNMAEGPSSWADEEFAKLWDTIHGSGAWAANPWVVAISFERIA